MVIVFKPLIWISILFFILSILNTVYLKPLSGFFTEYLFFVSFLFFVWASFVQFAYIRIPQKKILILLIFFSLLIDCLLSDNASIFMFIYFTAFFIMVVCGFNQINHQQIISFLSIIFLTLGILSSLFSSIQWLGFSKDYQYILTLIGNRPYANFSQPNHLATFLFLSLVSFFYLFEKQKINLFLAIVLSCCLMWGIVLTQSRTAWLVIFFIPLFLIFKSKKIDLKVTKLQLVSVVGVFWLMIISLPYVNQALAPYVNIAQSSTFIERATTGHLRLNIWNQMIHAIWEKPWFGYGWGQTTAAQYAVIDRYPGVEWASSAHNIILDLLVWCGIPFGLCIVLYFGYMYWGFLIKSKSTETVCSTLMISAVLIHAMLEFPLYYAYFLLPVGFLCGICLAEQNLRTTEVSNKWGYLIVAIGFLILYQVFKEYDQITDNMVAANTHEMNELKTELKLPYESIFFDKYEDRAKWIAQYPYMKVDQSILDLAERNLNSFLTSYDLYKYAVLLAHNDQRKKAELQLKILKTMYNQDHQYLDLFVKSPSVNVPLENSTANLIR